MLNVKTSQIVQCTESVIRLTDTGSDRQNYDVEHRTVEFIKLADSISNKNSNKVIEMNRVSNNMNKLTLHTLCG